MRLQEKCDLLPRFIKIGLYIILFLPLLLIPSHLYPFQVGKVLLFRIVIETLFFCYLMVRLWDTQAPRRSTVLEKTIFFFIIILFITSLTGVNFTRSFWGTSERMGGWFTFLHYGIFFMLLAHSFRTEKEWRRLFSCSVIAAVVSVVYGIGQSTLSHDLLAWFVSEQSLTNFFIKGNLLRPLGTIGNAGLWATYLVLNLCFAGYLYCTATSRSKHISYAMACVLLLFGVILSGTRSAILTLVVGALCWGGVILIPYFRSKKTKLLKIVLGVCLSVLVFSLLLKYTPLLHTSPILSRFTNISLQEVTVQTRLWTWQSAWKAWQERPILGWGPENVNIALNAYFDPRHFSNIQAETWFDRAHNIFLDLLVSSGIVGMIAWIGIFVALFFLFRKQYSFLSTQPATLALLVTFPVVYFVQNSFWFDSFSSFLLIFLFFGWCQFLLLSPQPMVKNPSISPSRINDLLRSLAGIIMKQRKLFSVMLLLLFISLQYVSNIIPWIFHRKITTAIGALHYHDPRALEYYQAVQMVSHPLGRTELRLLWADYVINIMSNQPLTTQEEVERLKKYLSMTITELESAVAENPKDAQLLFFLGTLYDAFSYFFPDAQLLEKSEAVLKQALEQSPTRPIILYELGQSMILKQDYAQAIAYFQQAVTLNFNVGVSHWYLGKAHGLAGNFDLAVTEMEQAITLGYEYNNAPDLFFLAKIYQNVGNQTKLNHILQQLQKLE